MLKLQKNNNFLATPRIELRILLTAKLKKIDINMLSTAANANAKILKGGEKSSKTKKKSKKKKKKRN